MLNMYCSFSFLPKDIYTRVEIRKGVYLFYQLVNLTIDLDIELSNPQIQIYQLTMFIRHIYSTCLMSYCTIYCTRNSTRVVVQCV